MTDEQYDAMTAEEKDAYQEAAFANDMVVCESCHEHHDYTVAGMYCELCKACSKTYKVTS